MNDLDQIVARYREVFGLSEPQRVNASGYDLAETTYQGEETEATAKLAFFDFGQVQLELIQPDAQPSVWQEHLNQKGDSAHHIAFQVRDTEQAINCFAEYGIGVAQGGLYGDRSGQYTYLKVKICLASVPSCWKLSSSHNEGCVKLFKLREFQCMNLR